MMRIGKKTGIFLLLAGFLLGTNQLQAMIEDERSLAPPEIQQATKNILEQMSQVLQKKTGHRVELSSIRPNLYRVHLGKRLADPPGTPLRGAASRKGIDLFTDSFDGADERTLATLIHELSHVILGHTGRRMFEPRNQKEFEAQHLAASTAFEMKLIGVLGIEIVKAPLKLIPFATKAFRRDRNKCHALGHLNSIASYKNSFAYRHLMRELKVTLSEQIGLDPATEVLMAIDLWKPVATYKEALRQYDRIAPALDHLREPGHQD
ncbi:hypothetical protein ACFLX2_00465 [Candidatus Dependentiae bacterium]